MTKAVIKGRRKLKKIEGGIRVQKVNITKAETEEAMAQLDFIFSKMPHLKRKHEKHCKLTKARGRKKYTRRISLI